MKQKSSSFIILYIYIFIKSARGATQNNRRKKILSKSRKRKESTKSTKLAILRRALAKIHSKSDLRNKVIDSNLSSRN
jgi:hypothetical protein